MTQVVDPDVSSAKFEREVDELRRLAVDYGRRGWFLADAEFPFAFVILAAPQLKPAPIVTGVAFDYSDYDLRPPSVRLVNPFTREPWPEAELPTRLRRRTESDGVPIPGLQLPPGIEAPKLVQEQPLIQAYPGEQPFLCIPGVREYHDHSAHSGDAWELHRGSGAGRLIRLLEILDTYGVRPINDYLVKLDPKIVGLSQIEPPT